MASPCTVGAVRPVDLGELRHSFFRSPMLFSLDLTLLILSYLENDAPRSRFLDVCNIQQRLPQTTARIHPFIHPNILRVSIGTLRSVISAFVESSPYSNDA